MKNLFSFFAFIIVMTLQAQISANVFFYELTYKPKKDSAKTEKVLMSLDITKDKSIYRDYTMASQDSILKREVEAMKNSGTFKDLSKLIKIPKFSYKVYKFYPDMKVEYTDRIGNGLTPMNIGYDENIKFNWKIENEKEKIGEYDTQKATTEYGGRKWTAWFSTDIPLQDGPYKFYGLPGLIVKLEDDEKNYSWVLKGNQKVNDYSEITYAESISPGGDGGKVMVLSREKFNTTFNDYKKDPMATARPYLTPEVLSKKLPGSDLTIGEIVKNQEKMLHEFYNSNDNPIEIDH